MLSNAYPCGKQHLREIATPDWVRTLRTCKHTHECARFVNWLTQSGVAISRKCCFPHGVARVDQGSPLDDVGVTQVVTRPYPRNLSERPPRERPPRSFPNATRIQSHRHCATRAQSSTTAATAVVEPGLTSGLLSTIRITCVVSRQVADGRLYAL